MQTQNARIWTALVVAALWLGPLPRAHAQPSPPFELVDGDRVVLLGGTFMEAAQEYGYIELALTTRWPDRSVSFRNVGWSGDTVHGDARLHFTNPPGPYERLLEEASAPRPTVVIVGYGANVPFEEAGGLSRFEDGLQRLLGDLESKTGARMILLSPPPHEADRSPVPAEVVRGTNETLAQVSDLIRGVARERGHRFVDLFAGLQDAERRMREPLTTDGANLNAAGYFLAAQTIEQGLGLPPRGWTLAVDAATGEAKAEGAAVVSADVQPDGAVVQLRPHVAPIPRPAALSAGAVLQARSLTVSGLKGGTYALTEGDDRMAAASSDAWADGVSLEGQLSDGQSERLRRLIVEKNRLYFHQYRPQNQTYLVGFRAYEQGQNAKELGHFSPLIDAKELEIGRLKIPAPLTFTLRPSP